MTEIGLTGLSGHYVLKFVMAENKQDSGSAVTQLHFMVVKTVRAIRESQELVTSLNVQVSFKRNSKAHKNSFRLLWLTKDAISKISVNLQFFEDYERQIVRRSKLSDRVVYSYSGLKFKLVDIL